MTKEEYRAVLDFLQGPYRKKQEIERLKETIAELRGCLQPSAIAYDGDGVQTSPENRQEETIVKIADMQDDLYRLYAERADLIVRVSDAIGRLQDPTEQLVLTLYYLARMAPAEVAKRIGYSERWMYKVKSRAVQKLFSEMQYRSML